VVHNSASQLFEMEKDMTKTAPKQNKALVLEAFDTLFNKRDYEAAAHFWTGTTSSTAPISSLAATACSTSSAARLPRYAMNTNSFWRRATTLLSTGASQATAVPSHG
jgi:hypothetical protein